MARKTSVATSTLNAKWMPLAPKRFNRVMNGKRAACGGPSLRQVNQLTAGRREVLGDDRRTGLRAVAEPLLDRRARAVSAGRATRGVEEAQAAARTGQLRRQAARGVHLDLARGHDRRGRVRRALVGATGFRRAGRHDALGLIELGERRLADARRVRQLGDFRTNNVVL